MTEGKVTTAEQLNDKWLQTLTMFDKLIDEQGMKLRPLRFLIRHIVEQGYSKSLYVGTSLYNLLISLPSDGRIDYSKTLRIEYDQLTQKVKFSYKDNSVDNWNEECQATEAIDMFEDFLIKETEWNKMKQRHANNR
ncbi:MAG: hypothetical protein K9J17_17725 [Flavobacteriales bacterium]|nr:hypothetical protein [Flavobacteriales bacterium]